MCRLNINKNILGSILLTDWLVFTVIQLQSVCIEPADWLSLIEQSIDPRLIDHFLFDGSDHQYSELLERVRVCVCV